ncbi:MAG: hypothetical protein IKR64_07985, partial [Treponema sp.]|nr:hypothetical protein [Treponema sp.]
MNIKLTDLKWYGRNFDYNKVRYFNYSCSGFEFCMTGKKAVATILSDPEKQKKAERGVIGVYVKELKSEKEYKGAGFWEHFPEGEPVRFVLDAPEKEYVLFESPVEKTVVIKVLKLSECAFGYAGLKKVDLKGVLELVERRTKNHTPRIEFIGDSITCGYGLEGVWGKDTFKTTQERPDKAYAFLTAKALGAEFQLCSWSGIGITSNYVDPETIFLPETSWLMPACWPYTDKKGQLKLKLEPEVWDASNFPPDIVVINLGTNDSNWVRGKEERRLAYVAGLRQLIEAVHRRSPKAKICCCLGIMGQELCDSVSQACKLF